MGSTKRESKNNWDYILTGEAVLSRRQAEEVKQHIADFRKNSFIESHSKAL